MKTKKKPGKTRRSAAVKSGGTTTAPNPRHAAPGAGAASTVTTTTSEAARKHAEFRRLKIRLKELDARLTSEQRKAVEAFEAAFKLDICESTTQDDVDGVSDSQADALEYLMVCQEAGWQQYLDMITPPDGHESPSAHARQVWKRLPSTRVYMWRVQRQSLPRGW